MKRIYPALTHAGILPFVAGALLLHLGGDDPILAEQVRRGLGAYSLIILSFIAGSHWGQHLQMNVRDSQLPALASNAIVLALWLAYLTLPFELLMLCCMGALLILLGVDQWLRRREVIDSLYFRLRCRVTAVVLLALGAAAAA